MRHPLYEIFLKREERIKRELYPLSEAVIAKPSPSTDYGKMGCLILGGGQGTRLGFDGPKGCVELPLREKKTLFQILFEKIKAKGKDFPVALMTSPLNHQATVDYLEKEKYFGLTAVSLFSQEMVPICDDEGNLVYDSTGNALLAPDGNGKAFHYLYRSGIWEKWKERGVQSVQVIPVDNPLADPFDGELLSLQEENELVVKCIKRNSPKEKMGVLAEEKEKLIVQEYSEDSPEEIDIFPYGNIGFFSARMDFIKRAVAIEMPWHLAHKMGENKEWIWKFETFIFDIFPYSDSFKVIVSERKKTFAPLKSSSGPEGLEAVAKALMTEKP